MSSLIREKVNAANASKRRAIPAGVPKRGRLDARSRIASLQAASTAGRPSVSTAVRMSTICRSRDGRGRAVLQHFAPAERTGDRLDNGVVEMEADVGRRHVRAVGSEDEFPAAGPADRNRDADGDNATTNPGTGET
jgi:hypothetical protein